jgi:hypothetical protein
MNNLYNAELAYTPQGDINVVLLKKGKPFIAHEAKISLMTTKLIGR